MTGANRESIESLEREFGRILEDSLNEIFIFDADTLRFIQVNRGARENLDYSLGELRQLTPIDIKPEYSREAFEELIYPLREGGEESIRFSTVHRRKDGSHYNVEVHLQLATFHDTPAFIAIILDTTESLRAEGDLRVRHRAIESVGVGVVITDASVPDMPIVYCNQAFQRITGYSRQEIVGHNCRFLQQNDRDQEARHAIRDSVNEGRECQTLIRNYRKNGELFWNSLTISPVRNRAGSLTHFVGLVDDVTTRVLAEDEKRDREARLAAILNTAVEAIITIDEHGECESVNGAAQQMFGYSAEEVIGNDVSMLMPSPYREEHHEYISSYVKTGVKKIIGIGREVVGRRKDGSEFPIHLSVSEVQLKERRIFTGFIQDISEGKAAQARLVQSERLAVLGEAMARLAHEGRNSLQRIQIAVETARMCADSEQALAAQFDAIEKASDGLDSLLEELRNYAAPMNLEKSECSLVNVWRSAWQSIETLRAGRDAKLVEEVSGESIRCSADPFRLGQLFRNIFENSLAACQDPVEITIRACMSPLGSKESWLIKLRDNGPGLADEQATRIFEPFFTTKSKGTGLGMAIARRIVEAHDGSISIGDAQQHGAEFIITLPV
ncbi:PAS domain S-box protein [Pirellulales bacterium]|nr:PAS domain S-box protein [Pirellulales bacterium]